MKGLLKRRFKTVSYTRLILRRMNLEKWERFSTRLRQEIAHLFNTFLPTTRDHLDGEWDARVIQESSCPWASPVVLVCKKDGTLCFYVDYQRLIAVTHKDIDDLLLMPTLDTGKFELSREKTAFATMEGLYEFRVMPFGLCNAPATFQWLLQKALAGLRGDNTFSSSTLMYSPVLLKSTWIIYRKFLNNCEELG